MRLRINDWVLIVNGQLGRNCETQKQKETTNQHHCLLLHHNFSSRNHHQTVTKKKLTNKKATGRTPVLVLAYLGSAIGAVAIVPRVASIADLVAAVLVRAHRRPFLHLLAALAAAPAVIRQPLGRPARGADATVYQDVYVDARTAAGPAALHGAVALDCRRTLADVGGFP